MNPAMPARADVCVVGGGPAGLAAAIAARQHGLSAMVVDAADAPADKCCGEGLLPDGLAALRYLGVSIPSDAARFRGIRFFNGAHGACGRFASGTGAGIRRTRLHQMLLDRALECGVACRFKTRAAGIGPDFVALADGQRIGARWIVGADGQGSQVCAWAGLDAGRKQGGARRYGFRRHYQVERAPEYVEVHWHDEFQVFVTPVSTGEVGVAMLTRNRSARLDYALERLPELRRRLGPPTSTDRGAVTANLSLRSIQRGNVALVGDASGAVDSITGEGLSLAFREAIHLGAALARHDLASYERMHRQVLAPARRLAHLLLLLADHSLPRWVAIRFLEARPGAFQALLPEHRGEAAPMAAVAGEVR